MPGWEETPTQRRARYAAIAEDLFQVAYDPKVSPLYDGPFARARSASLVLAVAFHESGFAADVDRGPCYRFNQHESRCDYGRSACIMQVQVGPGRTREGYTQADLFADRKKCFRAGMAILRASMSRCRHLPERQWLNAYASGTCTKGQARSREMHDLAAKFATLYPYPGGDHEFQLPEAPPAPPAPRAPPAEPPKR